MTKIIFNYELLDSRIRERMRYFIAICTCFFLSLEGLQAQKTSLEARAKNAMDAYFATYPHIESMSQPPRLEKLFIDTNSQSVTITASSSFAQQDFTSSLVRKVYNRVQKVLPRPLNKFKINIVINGIQLEQYVPDSKLSPNESWNLWGALDYKGAPWAANISSPANTSKGLRGRHISLWASHGRYYDNEHKLWKWQRPFLFCTTEDLFTQTIVIPYLIPMLQNAGAVVFTPRERDWQEMEYIVDPDGGLNTSNSCYSEYSGINKWESTQQQGFAAHNGPYQDNENPFAAGSSKQIKTTKKAGKAFIKWQPYFIKRGNYAVYVSYTTLDNSIDDAHYTVFHQGIATEFRVNQRMGGSTWVYLGTFTFDAGSSIDNCVMLTNQSHTKGIVTADAVRFGGGMGNIERGGSISGYPRTLEGARYAAQWAGAPYDIYGGRKGLDDYSDDINTRSLMSNWLSGGSVYNPVQDGKGVPIELSLAVHSDAGYASDGKTRWGSLAICTTDFNDGQLASGVTRQASKIFAGNLLNNAVRDLSNKYDVWPKRYLWDRNYSETRLPGFPSAIIETMSHQNFPDMLLGQDPNFKFDFARSLYKTIARFINGMHGHPTVIEPLQPLNVAISLKGDRATLSWSPQKDSQESTSTPTYFIVYTAVGNGGFDNGVKTNRTSFHIDLEPGIPYHFKVTAGNRGGESFPSETVSAVYEPKALKTILVINGFHRLSAPAVINDGKQQGFDLDSDIGVSYGLTAGWSGKQYSFDMTQMGKETSSGLGYSGNELAGHFVAGNDFNYIIDHCEAIASAHQYNVVSCSSKAVETGIVNLNNYDAVDLILGLEKFTPNQTRYYKTFPPEMMQKLTEYTAKGGKLLISGAYIGSDNCILPSMDDEEGTTKPRSDNSQWLSQTLHVSWSGTIKTDTIQDINGLGLDNLHIYKTPNADHYCVQFADKLSPTSDAFCAMQYGDGSPAAVAFDGHQTSMASRQVSRTFVMGFPFESIMDKPIRAVIMKGILAFLFRN